MTNVWVDDLKLFCTELESDQPGIGQKSRNQNSGIYFLIWEKRLSAYRGIHLIEIITDGNSRSTVNMSNPRNTNYCAVHIIKYP